MIKLLILIIRIELLDLHIVILQRTFLDFFISYDKISSDVYLRSFLISLGLTLFLSDDIFTDRTNSVVATTQQI